MTRPNHPSTLFENASVAFAVVVLGLMAGFFGTYTYNVNLATMQMDGAAYATVQSLLNKNVRHTGFFILFFGGFLFPTLALVVNYRHWRTFEYGLMVSAALLYGLGIVLLTRQVNLPLNAYTESWSPAQLPVDWAAIREQWNNANLIRVWVAIAAFALCLMALVLRASKPHKSYF